MLTIPQRNALRLLADGASLRGFVLIAGGITTVLQERGFVVLTYKPGSNVPMLKITKAGIAAIEYRNSPC